MSIFTTCSSPMWRGQVSFSNLNISQWRTFNIRIFGNDLLLILTEIIFISDSLWRNLIICLWFFSNSWVFIQLIWCNLLQVWDSVDLIEQFFLDNIWSSSPVTNTCNIGGWYLLDSFILTKIRLLFFIIMPVLIILLRLKIQLDLMFDYMFLRLFWVFVKLIGWIFF